MIYDDFQRKVTIKAADKFRTAVKELSQIPKEKISDLRWHQNYIAAHRRQAEELEAEKAEYELIRSGKVKIKVTSVNDLGKNLVYARIKSGMDQAALAKRVKVNKGLIVRSEVNQYSNTAIEIFRKVAKLLNVEIPENVLPSNFNGKMSVILTKLKKAGLDRKFVLSRLVRPCSYVKVTELSGEALDKYTFGLYTHLNHIFGWTWKNLLSADDLTAPIANTARVKFKVEPNRSPEKINVYSMYAHYLARIVKDNAKNLVNTNIPATAIAMRKAIIDSYGSIDLENTLNYAWDCGVIVIPLDIKGNFHGACIRINGRNVIILNPRKQFIATWLFDLLHELSHARQEPEKVLFDEIEEVVTSHERRMSKEEIDANDFANAVIFGKDAENLLNQCIEQADGNLNLLKKVIQKIAQENHVLVGALANYIAHESKSDSKFKYKKLLTMAENLQLEDGEPYQITRKVFTKRCRLKTLEGIDVSLIFQAMEDV